MFWVLTALIYLESKERQTYWNGDVILETVRIHYHQNDKSLAHFQYPLIYTAKKETPISYAMRCILMSLKYAESRQKLEIEYEEN